MNILAALYTKGLYMYIHLCFIDYFCCDSGEVGVHFCVFVYCILLCVIETSRYILNTKIVLRATIGPER